jgi:hypothetical protein
MFALSSGFRPAKVVRALAAPFVVASLAALQAGCAADSNAYATTPVVAAYVAQIPETEDDGLPSQDAPPARIRQMPDDPSQPYSRNYGGPNPAAAADAPEKAPADRADAQAVPPAIPADLPPAFRRQLAQAGYATE